VAPLLGRQVLQLRTTVERERGGGDKGWRCRGKFMRNNSDETKERKESQHPNIIIYQHTVA